MWDMLARWWMAMITRKRERQRPPRDPFNGVPHAGTLSDGRRIYSTMPVLISNPDRVVFGNGSWIKLAPTGFRVNVKGSLIITDEEGRVSLASSGVTSITNKVDTRP